MTNEPETSSDGELADRISAWMGTGLLACASLLAILIFADRSDLQFFPMPRMWFATRNLHILFCCIMFFFAAVLLKGRGTAIAEREAPRPVFRTVRFFTRGGCHLCDDALDVIRKFQEWLPAVEVIDIDQDASLRRQFGESVPVVEFDDRVRFRGAVPQELLRRLIDGRRLQLDLEGQPSSSGLQAPSGAKAERSSPETRDRAE